MYSGTVKLTLNGQARPAMADLVVSENSADITSAHFQRDQWPLATIKR